MPPPPDALDKFWDGQTIRPAWAGPLHVLTEEVTPARSHSDNRDGHDLPETIERPIRVSGIVCPVSTEGRKTADVYARDLRHMPEDRGHLMALSLGAPDHSCQVVPQPRLLNQRLRHHGAVDQEASRSRGLSWRGTEVYALHCALLAFARQNTLPLVDEWVEIRHYPQAFIVNGVRLAPPTLEEYGEAGSSYGAGGRFSIRFQAEPRYRNRTRGNDPYEILLELFLVRPHMVDTRLCANVIRNEPSAAAANQHLGASARSIKRKRFLMEDAQTWKEEHLRQDQVMPVAKRRRYPSLAQ